MGGCRQPGCDNTRVRRNSDNWYCDLTKKKCVGVSDTGGYNPSVATRCPGYCLPKDTKTGVREFRKSLSREIREFKKTETKGKILTELSHMALRELI